jgi:transmembrane sensor
MKAFHLLDVEELAADPFFKESMLRPTTDSQKFWNTWKQQFPERKEIYEHAAIFVKTIQWQFRDNLTDEVQELELLKLSDALNHLNNPVHQTKTYLWKYSFAAMVVLSIGMGWLYRIYNQPTDPVNIAATRHAAAWTTFSNTLAHSRTIILQDSSTIRLHPGAILLVHNDYNGQNRHVKLNGGAFFQITKNAKKPFIVLNNKIVVKVLGTSFEILGNPDTDSAVVNVETGKVAVFPQQKTPTDELSDYLNPNILLPGEQIVYHHKTEKFIKRNPTVFQKKIHKPKIFELIFDDVPVSTVFHELERYYGIEIVFNESQFIKCPINTTLENDNLLENLNYICEAIGVSYQLTGGKIVIKGNGCAI